MHAEQTLLASKCIHLVFLSFIKKLAVVTVHTFLKEIIISSVSYTIYVKKSIQYINWENTQWVN